MTDINARCDAGCIPFEGGERKHTTTCPFYPESRTKMYDDALARIAELEAQVTKARENALREAADEVHQECWTDGPMSETLMAEQETTVLAIRAIQSLIDKKPKA